MLLTHYYTTFIQFLNRILPCSIIYITKNTLTIVILPEHLNMICKFLYNNSYLQCKILNYITCIDYPDRKYRFEILYNLASLQYNFKINLKIRIKEIQITLPTITNIYLNAYWYEREIWDLFGVYFQNNPDLRPILSDYGFEGYPLRKDFPLSGYIELNYNTIKQTCVYTSIELTQISKNLNTISLWQ